MTSVINLIDESHGARLEYREAQALAALAEGSDAKLSAACDDAFDAQCAIYRALSGLSAVALDSELDRIAEAELEHACTRLWDALTFTPIGPHAEIQMEEGFDAERYIEILAAIIRHDVRARAAARRDY